MRTIAEFRDLYLEAKTDVEQMIAEARAEWLEPDERLQVAVMAETIEREMPEAWQFVDPQVQQRLLEVFNG